MGLEFEVLSMPAVMLSGCVLLVVSTTLAFIFTCQTSFESKHEKGKEFFRRMTRMTISGKTNKEDRTTKTSLESKVSANSKPSARSSDAIKETIKVAVNSVNTLNTLGWSNWAK